MNKIKLTNHIKDIELKNKMFKVIDKANRCLKHFDVKCTDFLNPYEIKNAVAILNSFNDIIQDKFLVKSMWHLDKLKAPK